MVGRSGGEFAVVGSGRGGESGAAKRFVSMISQAYIQRSPRH